MGDHIVLCVDRLINHQTVKTVQTAEGSDISSGEPSHALFPSVPVPSEGSSSNKDREENSIGSEEDEPLIQMVECRICQEEDHIKNLETPCACSGSRSMLTGHVCSAGAMRKEIQPVRFVMRRTSLITLHLLDLTQMRLH